MIKTIKPESIFAATKAHAELAEISAVMSSHLAVLLRAQKQSPEVCKLASKLRENLQQISSARVLLETDEYPEVFENKTKETQNNIWDSKVAIKAIEPVIAVALRGQSEPTN